MNYKEKIEKIKGYIGEFPPPFDPPWCIQVSSARCGSNALWEMVASFLGEDAIGYPSYEQMENKGPDSNWIPEPGKKYLYYNIFDCDPNRLHFPIFFWMLQNCEKVVFLNRQDFLTQSISLYYANLIIEYDPSPKRAYHYPEIFEKPIDMDEFDKLFLQNFYKMHLLEQIVNTYVDPKRLHIVNFADLYHHNTLKTLGSLVRFLGVDPSDIRVNVRVQRETLYDKIPNLADVSAKYERDDFTERTVWAPDWVDTTGIYDDVDRGFKEMLFLNLGISTHLSNENPAKMTSPIFDLKPGSKFYIDHIPIEAQFLRHDEFEKLPNMADNLYLLDTRWKNTDVVVPSHIHELLKVERVHSNRVRDYKWVCGFSVFFMKYVMPSQKDAKHRVDPKKHDDLIKGVRTLIEYEDRCPETLLRFYVSPEACNRIHAEGLIDSPGTEFYIMEHSSEDSQIGAIWRMLALFDTEFEWAIETDVAHDEDWVLARIAHWERQLFYSWMESKTDREWAYVGEYLISESMLQSVEIDSFCFDISPWDYMSGGGIVTRPERMPPVESVIHRHIMERPLQHTYYHAGEHVWCQMPGYISQIPMGWEGWGIDQAVWGRLKSMCRTRHLISDHSVENMEALWDNISDNHILKRIISQLISEGSEFVHFRTFEPIFNFDV